MVNVILKVKFSSPVELSSKQTSLNDRWFMLENKKIKYSSSSSSGSSQQQRNRNISEIILEFDKEHVNLIETVVVLDFDTGFKDLVADAAASSPSTLLASKNVLDLHEEETIVQKLTIIMLVNEGINVVKRGRWKVMRMA